MINTDFSVPQRQSKLGLIVLFANSVFGFLKAMWIVIILFFINADQSEIVKGIGFVAISLLFFAIYSYLKYHNFTFYVDDHHDEFVVQHGIVNKTKTVVQLHKIQQVNLKQNLIQRLVDVYQIDIDSAGSEHKEGMITAVSKAVAMDLKEKLLNNERQFVDKIKQESIA